MMYAAITEFVIDRKIKNLTITCITFSQHRNQRHQKKKDSSPSPRRNLRIRVQVRVLKIWTRVLPNTGDGLGRRCNL